MTHLALDHACHALALASRAQVLGKAGIDGSRYNQVSCALIQKAYGVLYNHRRKPRIVKRCLPPQLV